jgi:hypothetical protein
VGDTRERPVSGKALRRKERLARRRAPYSAPQPEKHPRPRRPNPGLTAVGHGMVCVWRWQVLLVELLTLAVMAMLFFGVPLLPVSAVTVLAVFAALYWLLMLAIWRLKLEVWKWGRLLKGDGYVNILDRIFMGEKADQGDHGSRRWARRNRYPRVEPSGRVI